MTSRELPYKNKGDLTTGPIPAHLIRLSLPMLWAMLVLISVQLVDTFFIAMLGPTQLTGMSFTFPVTMLISHLIFGFNVAMSSVVSRLIGERKMADGKRIVLHGVTMAFLFSCVISLIAYIFLDPLFRALGADAETMPVVRDYMPVWLIGSAILAIPVNANSAVRAAGDTFLPSLVMVSIALVNLALAPLFIFGWLGFPAWGVFGAAVAALIAYICGTFFGLYVLIILKDLVARDGLHLDKLKDSIKRLAVIAIPAGIGNVIMPATAAIITAALARHGADAVAAFGVASRIEAFAMIAVIALALGLAPLVGQNWGAGFYARVHETINLSIRYNFIWSLFVAAALALFAYPIGMAFSSDPETLKYLTLYFWIVPVTYGFGNLVFGWSATFNAMGSPRRAFVMIAAKAFVLTVPAVFIGGWLYGVGGIFLGLALVNLISGTFFHVISWRACLRREEPHLSAPGLNPL